MSIKYALKDRFCSRPLGCTLPDAPDAVRHAVDVGVIFVEPLQAVPTDDNDEQREAIELLMVVEGVFDVLMGTYYHGNFERVH